MSKQEAVNFKNQWHKLDGKVLLLGPYEAREEDLGDQVRSRRHILASSDLSRLWAPAPVENVDPPEYSQVVAPAGAPFSFYFSWLDNEKNVPDKEWHVCETKVLNPNPKSFYPAGHFTRHGKRMYLLHMSQPLPQLHPGSWDPDHASPLLLFS